MNENETKIEKLLALADHAEQEGDLETALQLIAKASQLAPFRSDLRERHASLLEKRTVQDPFKSQTAAHAEFGAPFRESSSFPDAERTVPTNERYISSESFGENDNGDAGREVSAHTFRPIYTVEDEKPRMAAPKNASRNAQPGHPAASTSAESWAAETSKSIGETKNPEKTASRNRARRRQISDVEPEADLLSGIKESGRRFFSRRVFPSLSYEAKAAIAVYTVVALFVLTSSITTYRRFFREQPINKSLAAVATSPGETSTQVANSKESRSEKLANNSEALQLLKLAKDYIRQKRYEDATTLLAGQLEKISDPTLRQTFEEELARAYDLLGTSLLEKNRLVQSVAAYEKATKLAPSSTVYLLHLANAHYYCGILLGSGEAKKYLELAENEVAKVLERDPRNLDAYQLQASVRERTANIKGAVDALSKIVELAPPASQEAKLAREKMNQLSLAR